MDDIGRQMIVLLPNLRRFAISLCRSGDIADDLVQETCEKALANQDKFKVDTRLDAWLFRILRNSWIDRIRHAKTRGISIDIDNVHDLVGADGRASTEHRMMLDVTARAMAKLPDNQREVLILVCVEDLSYRETAALLDVPVGTVMSRLARARKKLVEVLGINSPPVRS